MNEKKEIDLMEKIPTFEELKKARELYVLHNKYLHGDEVEKNVKKGIELCIKAATMGDIFAQYDLAIYYDNCSLVVNPMYYDKKNK